MGKTYHPYRGSVSIPDSVNELVRRIAEIEDRTLSTIIRRAVLLYAQENGYELEDEDAAK